MKKLISIVILLVLVVSLSSCGTKYAADEKGNDYYYNKESSDVEFDGADKAPSSSEIKNDIGNRKIIKNVNMSIESKEYDKALQTVKNLINTCGGYIQNATYRDNAGNYNYRSSEIVARIPAENLEEFSGNISKNCTVTYYNEKLDDVTMQYIDIESRISSLEKEMDALEALLEKADDLNYIISLEQRISDVRYELEKYESSKRTYDDLISYSTVTMNISEVERETVVETQNTWQEIASNFTSNLQDIGEGFRRFFIGFVSGLPYIVIVAVIAVVAVIIVKAIVKKHKK